MLLLAVMLTMTAQTAWADSAFSGGSGSKGDPYKIASTADLNQLATDVNGGNDYSGKYFVLTQDITYNHTGLGDTESNYEAIGGDDGTNNRYFRGTFDGANHTVSGIRIYKGGNDETDRYQGLFGQISSPAEVKNVILADARITGYDYTDAIVGYTYKGTVTDCHALADVTVHTVQSDANNHGGIAGLNNGTVTGCTSTAALTTAGSNSSNVGGIAGRNGGSGTVTHCIYLGTTLVGAKYVGAIVGENFYNESSGNRGTVGTSYYTDTAIKGKDDKGTTLDNTASAVGYNGGTVANSGLARTVTLGDTPTGEGRVKAYGNYALSYNDGTTTTIYSTAGSTLALAYSGTAPAGYRYDGCTANGTIHSGSTCSPTASTAPTSRPSRATATAASTSASKPTSPTTTPASATPKATTRPSEATAAPSAAPSTARTTPSAASASTREAMPTPTSIRASSVK